MTDPEPVDEEARREAQRAYRRRWQAENPEKVQAYKLRYRETHRQELSAREQGRAARAKEAEARKEAKRVYAREYYAAHRDTQLEVQRAYRESQKRDNPGEYRARRRAANQKWRDTHREQVRQHQRDKDRDDPIAKSRGAARYRAAHADEMKARRLEKYWVDPDAARERARVYRASERRRRKIGLPPRRLHRITGAERIANLAAAEAFFARTRTPEEIAALIYGPPTPQHLIDELVHANELLRAEFAYRTGIRTSADRLGRGRRRELEQELIATGRVQPPEERCAPTPDEVARAAEAARMDAIAAAINDRLRTQPKHPAPQLDPPPAVPTPTDHRRGRGR
ncbi:hypothetical protein [Microbacterium telephonicum]|uniref:Uncharacterized protein n=1 Tax=Microbacterium telephonicum TaxID=1714841 RepID=A0A498CD61_9MICO|nr:hypothetical protein [Microbacterium telephonicum]RLK52486.1 hypothetical protein C7474_0426 [Microbacterium telephonicum]